MTILKSLDKCKNNKEAFIKCECGSEGLHIEKEECDGDIYLSLWYYGNQNLSCMHKLEWIWNVIKGKPYSDCVIIHNESLSELIKILKEFKDKE